MVGCDRESQKADEEKLGAGESCIEVSGADKEGGGGGGGGGTDIELVEVGARGGLRLVGDGNELLRWKNC